MSPTTHFNFDLISIRFVDIGDRIHVGDPNSEANANGSSTWFVRDVGLFTTTVCYAATNEVATLSNGSLASSRIINAARSPEASVFILLKFPISASYEKLKIFRNVLEEFVRARPREYLSFSGFRCTRVEADLGFVEYSAAVTHRESWQNLRTIITSKAELASFSLELSKKMKLRFVTPPMPIDLRMNPATMSAFGVDPANYASYVQSMADDDCSHVLDEGEINAVRAIFDT
jgi:small-conductance mechanosensitive channel